MPWRQHSKESVFKCLWNVSESDLESRCNSWWRPSHTTRPTTIEASLCVVVMRVNRTESTLLSQNARSDHSEQMTQDNKGQAGKSEQGLAGTSILCMLTNREPAQDSQHIHIYTGIYMHIVINTCVIVYIHTVMHPCIYVWQCMHLQLSTLPFKDRWSGVTPCCCL